MTRNGVVFKGNFRNNKKFGEGVYVHVNGEEHKTMHAEDEGERIDGISFVPME